MGIRVGAEDRIGQIEDEEVWLPGPKRGDEDEGPFPFRFPRVAKLLDAADRMKRTDDILTALSTEMDSTLRWIADGFGDEAWAHISARLEDDGDVLDKEHMLVLAQKLNEQRADRPTTSSGGASRPAWKKSPTAAPSLPASGSGT